MANEVTPVPEEAEILAAAMKALEEGCAQSGHTYQMTRECLNEAQSHYKGILYKNATQTKDIVSHYKDRDTDPKWSKAMKVVTETGKLSVEKAPATGGTRQVTDTHFKDAYATTEADAINNGRDWC
jgi:hypothetical protein